MLRLFRRRRRDQQPQEKEQSSREAPAESTSKRLFVPKQKPIHLQVGLDFGTTSTKVVIFEHGRRRREAYSFDHGLEAYPPYCLPAVCAIDREGRVRYGAQAAQLLARQAWNSGLRHLKVHVAAAADRMFADDSLKQDLRRFASHGGMRKAPRVETVAAGYLAHCIRVIRRGLETRPEYRGVPLNIAFNICMPVDHMMSPRVRSAFQRLFARAEALALSTIDLEDPEQLDTKLPGVRSRRVFAVPEAVASFESYVNSLQSHEGLYAVVDLGAGTTDVSICRLANMPNGFVTYWFAARNIPGGTRTVDHAIVQYVAERIGRNTLTNQELARCFAKLDVYAHRSDRFVSVIRSELDAVRSTQAYSRTWGAAYAHLRQEGHWKKARVFITGGGAQLPTVRRVFAVPWWNHLQVRYYVELLPEPQDYEAGQCEAPFHRMSVAYGLSRPLPELERYFLPNQSGDHTPLRSYSSIPDADALYSDG